ncbi:MAG: translocation/assembly module TamB, partial [Prevotellaceae bacterium]|nr:translocation/assembly module TamB [Prevotellaceae bacterium]
MILTHIPPIQRFIGTQVGNALGSKLGTQVTIGRVDLGLFNRFIIDDISILDQHGCPMISAGRVSAKFDYLPLTEGKISISSAQLFGLQAHFYKPSALAKANYQFVLDSLASKDTTSHKPLDLSIRSLIIRNGHIRYDQNDIAKTGTFSTKHLNISNLSTHIMLNAIKDDSVNVFVKKFSGKEQSGLELKGLTFNLIAGTTSAQLSQFEAQLPHSTLTIPNITVSYRRVGTKIEPATIQFDGSIDHTDITPADLTCFVPTLRPLTHPVDIRTTFRGTSTTLRISDLKIAYKAKTIIAANGSITDWNATPKWTADIQRITVSAADVEDIAQAIKNRFQLPAVV